MRAFFGTLILFLEFSLLFFIPWGPVGVGAVLIAGLLLILFLFFFSEGQIVRRFKVNPATGILKKSLEKAGYQGSAHPRILIVHHPISFVLCVRSFGSRGTLFLSQAFLEQANEVQIREALITGRLRAKAWNLPMITAVEWVRQFLLDRIPLKSWFHFDLPMGEGRLQKLSPRGFLFSLFLWPWLEACEWVLKSKNKDFRLNQALNFSHLLLK